VSSRGDGATRLNGATGGMLDSSFGAELDGLTDRFIHRRGSRLVLRLLIRLRLTPNAVTLIGLALGLAAAWQFWHATVLSALLGLLLYSLEAVADHADGDLARLTGRESALGRWLDVSADTASNILVVLGMAATAGLGGGPATLLAGAVAAAGVLASSLLVNFFPPPNDRAGRAILRLANRDLFYLVLIGFILLLWSAEWLLPYLIWVLAVGSQGYWLLCLAERALARRRHRPSHRALA